MIIMLGNRIRKYFKNLLVEKKVTDFFNTKYKTVVKIEALIKNKKYSFRSSEYVSIPKKI